MRRVSSALRGLGGFDNLRFLFAAMVILSHSFVLPFGNRSHEPLEQLFPRTNLGELAVMGFFAVSGYLIAQSWDRSPTALGYLRNRALRIIPGFVVAYVVATLVVGAIGSPSAGVYFSAMDWPDFLLRLITVHEPETPATFVDLPFPGVDDPMWSIRYEVLCYAIAPFVIFRRSTAVACWFVCAFGAICAPHTRTSFILMFVTGALYWRLGLDPRRLGLLGGVVCLAAAAFLARTWAYPVGVAVFLMPIVLAVGLMSAARKLPDLSYGIYLYGWPVQKLLTMAGILDPAILLALSLPLSALAGAASWFLIEKRALGLKRPLNRVAVQSPVPA